MIKVTCFKKRCPKKQWWLGIDFILFHNTWYFTISLIFFEVEIQRVVTRSKPLVLPADKITIINGSKPLRHVIKETDPLSFT